MLKKWVNSTELDAIHDHCSQDSGRDKYATLEESITQTLHIVVDVAFETPFFAKFDGEDADQTFLEDREDNEREDRFQEYLDTVNGNVVVFLIKATRNDKAGTECKTTVRKAQRKVLLDQKPVKREFTDERVVLHREAHDHQHVKPEYKKNDE